MSSKPKLGVDWRRIVEALARMLLLPQSEAPRERLIPVREPRQAEIEHWLRNRK
ncbi:hypothetical protein [Methylocystis sp. SC2]|uniref:hypothetical protein n=1 Tax=Methylocystis sp. (strain SC2) TaxID=187303 RepID=UPI00027AEC6D|nr:hypothetical protein [Methylocystis sp. SC2]CCJ06896.1 Hypothetical protein BN69_1445 [Methylocystis sp. SC2]